MTPRPKRPFVFPSLVTEFTRTLQVAKAKAQYYYCLVCRNPTRESNICFKCKQKALAAFKEHNATTGE